MLWLLFGASHLERLLLSVSCGKGTKSAAKLNSLPSNQRSHDLGLVYWTPGPTWKSSHRDKERTKGSVVGEGEVKNKIMQSQSGPLQNHLKPHVAIYESNNPLYRDPDGNQSSRPSQEGCDCGLKSRPGCAFKPSDQWGCHLETFTLCIIWV